MIAGILIYLCIGMWLAADVLRFAPRDLEAPDWFIAVATTFLWPIYVIYMIIFLVRL